MAVNIVTGVPGAGKSYYAVHSIARLMQTDEQFVVVTNIDGLKIDDTRVLKVDFAKYSFRHADMVQFINAIRDLFQLDSQAKVHFYIDEAQRFFPPDLRDTDTVYFFDYHRHLGINIILITQDFYKISKRISTLANCEIRAVNESINPLPFFIYRMRSGGEDFKKIKLHKKDEIFKLYTSFVAGGVDKKDRSMSIKLVVVLLAFVLLSVLFFKNLGDAFGRRKEQIQNIHNATTLEVVNMSAQPANATDDEVLDLPEYKVPIPLRYNSANDTVLYMHPKLGMRVKCSVKSFVNEYPNFIYDYAYVHVKNVKFEMYRNGFSEMIFPYHHVLKHMIVNRAVDTTPPGDDGADEQSRDNSVYAAGTRIKKELNAVRP